MLKQKRKRTNLLAIAIGGLFLGTGLFAAVSAWGAYWTDTTIVKSGERAAGHLTKKDFLFVADGDSDYAIEYWFSLPNQERVVARRNVSKALWTSLRKEDTFQVHYSKENPNRNFPAGVGVTSLGVASFVSAFGALFAAGGALLIAGSLRRKSGEA
jgi:hypothetical protein